MLGTTAAGAAAARPGHVLHAPTSHSTPSTQRTADCPAHVRGCAHQGRIGLVLSALLVWTVHLATTWVSVYVSLSTV